MLYEMKYNDLIFKIKQETRVPYGKNGHSQIKILVECPFCKIDFLTVRHNINTGHTISCGCYKKEYMKQKLTKHGLSFHPLYIRVRGGIDRCNNKLCPAYNNYGGRGIEWRLGGFKESIEYLETLENSHIQELQMDRIDVNGHYEKGNIRFVSSKVNMNNLRTNVNLTFNGKTQSIAMWGEELGIPHGTILSRHKSGYSIDKILGTNRIPKKSMLVEINGEELSMREISEKYSACEKTLYYRYSKGIRGNELLLPMKRKSVNELPK